MTHKLPKLPYAYDALEPHCDAATVRLHHDKHHQTYVDNLNKLIEGRPALQPKSVEELLGELDAIPNDIRQAVVNNAGGHYNHSLFWRLMGPNQVGNPSGPIREAIASTFGSFDEFKDKFKEAALGLFGSGWTFLVASKDGKLASNYSGTTSCV
jgi:Fe-Mn family superoxide dismutase